MNCRIPAISVLAIFAVRCVADRRADARPKFAKIFDAHYEKEFAGKEVKTKSCTVCHDKSSDNKQTPNAYGAAMTEFLKKKNESDEAVIRSAIKDTEAKPSAIEGKTFGDLIKEGKLPASK